MSIRRYDPKPHWSRAVSAGSLLFLSGQTAHGAEHCADVAAQTREVLRRIAEILAANGGNRADLVSATLYLKNIEDLPQVNEVWADWLQGQQAPARATVQAVLAHPDLLVEISVVAMPQLPHQGATS